MNMAKVIDNDADKDNTNNGEETTSGQDEGEFKVKIICLGDSAVGKSKLMERFLIDSFKPHQSSTYAVTLYKYDTEVDGRKVSVDLWDTAGQERFNSMHSSYYHQAHACIMVFDATRKITYKNLANWYKELRKYRPNIPCLCAANKIDADMSMTQKSFNFPKKYKLPFYFVSAAKGTNVVKLFKDSIQAAIDYKLHSKDFFDEVMKELENIDLTYEGSSSDNLEDSQNLEDFTS